MKQIEVDKVKRDNSNIRKFSDSLWRVLRKERFKKANPDMFTNEMAAEELGLRDASTSDFDCDVDSFAAKFLTKREESVLRLFLYGGKVCQTEMGEILQVSQPTITNELRRILLKFAEYYYADRLDEVKIKPSK